MATMQEKKIGTKRYFTMFKKDIFLLHAKDALSVLSLLKKTFFAFFRIEFYIFSALKLVSFKSFKRRLGKALFAHHIITQ